MVHLSSTASEEHMSMMAHSQRDISDSIWEKPEPHLPDREGSWGGGAHDNRRFVNAVFILEEDSKLLMWYDQAVTRWGRE